MQPPGLKSLFESESESTFIGEKKPLVLNQQWWITDLKYPDAEPALWMDRVSLELT